MIFHDLPNGGLLLIAEAARARLKIGGIDATAFRALLRGRPIPAPGLTLDLDNPDADSSTPGQPGPASTSSTADSTAPIPLADGDVITASGGSARVVLSPTTGATQRLLPKSLNLGLAQQWARTGRMMVHGACLSTRDQGILILGRKASGKSVMSLAALTAGLRVVSDDWLLLSAEGDTLGAEGDAPTAERLREFLMLRESWASRRLRIQWPDAPDAPAPGRPKHIIATDLPDAPVSASFPRTSPITGLWLLRRPDGARGSATRCDELPRAAALAALIESTMPLLFSDRFPVERNRLMAASRRLIARVQPRLVTTGTDLIEAPAETLQRLLPGNQ